MTINIVYDIGYGFSIDYIVWCSRWEQIALCLSILSELVTEERNGVEHSDELEIINVVQWYQTSYSASMNSAESKELVVIVVFKRWKNTVHSFWAALCMQSISTLKVVFCHVSVEQNVLKGSNLVELISMKHKTYRAVVRP